MDMERIERALREGPPDEPAYVPGSYRRGPGRWIPRLFAVPVIAAALVVGVVVGAGLPAVRDGGVGQAPDPVAITEALRGTRWTTDEMHVPGLDGRAARARVHDRRDRRVPGARPVRDRRAVPPGVRRLPADGPGLLRRAPPITLSARRLADPRGRDARRSPRPSTTCPPGAGCCDRRARRGRRPGARVRHRRLHAVRGRRPARQHGLLRPRAVRADRTLTRAGPRPRGRGPASRLRAQPGSRRRRRRATTWARPTRWPSNARGRAPDPGPRERRRRARGGRRPPRRRRSRRPAGRAARRRSTPSCRRRTRTRPVSAHTAVAERGQRRVVEDRDRHDLDARGATPAAARAPRASPRRRGWRRRTTGARSRLPPPPPGRPRVPRGSPSHGRSRRSRPRTAEDAEQRPTAAAVLVRALDQPRDLHELDEHAADPGERGHRAERRERVVARPDLDLRERLEQRRLAHVGRSDEGDLRGALAAHGDRIAMDRARADARLLDLPEEPLAQVRVRPVAVVRQLVEQRPHLADPLPTLLAHEAPSGDLGEGPMRHRHDCISTDGGRHARRPGPRVVAVRRSRPFHRRWCWKGLLSRSCWRWWSARRSADRRRAGASCPGQPTTPVQGPARYPQDVPSVLSRKVPLAELHCHLGAAVTPSIMWSIAHAQGIKLPTRDYWEFRDLITVHPRRPSPSTATCSCSTGPSSSSRARSPSSARCTRSSAARTARTTSRRWSSASTR